MNTLTDLNLSLRYEFLFVTNGAIKNEIYIRDKADEFNTQWLVYKDIDEVMINTLFDHLLKFEQPRKAIFHLNAVQRFTGNKRLIVEQIIKCNWAPLDEKIDMQPDTLNFEYVECQYRGKCPFAGEGIVCIKTKKQ